MIRRSLVAVLLCLAALSATAQEPTRRTAVVRAVEKARLSVVNISTEQEVQVRTVDPFFGDDIFDEYFRDFFGRRSATRRKVEGPLGSGVIIDAAGYVVTNEHVVRRATNITLSLPDGTTCEAELLAADPVSDVALLKVVKPKGLRAITMGASGDLMLGEPVIALGNPFGFENSVTSGIVSALHRSITVGQGRSAIEYEDLIQTSALINPGNSGGALLNIHGDLIGINTAVVGGAQGIGFAIPVNAVRDVLARLFAGPRVTNAWLGMTLDRKEGDPGARVATVEPEGPADAAGLRKGDQIVSLANTPVRDPFDVRHRLLKLAPGTTVSFDTVREGKTQTVRVTSRPRPKLTPLKLVQKRLGMSVQNISRAMARQLGLRVAVGVVVTEIEDGGAAANIGLRQNDVVIQFGSHRVRDLDDMAAVLNDAQAGERLLIQIIRGRVRAYARIVAR